MRLIAYTSCFSMRENKRGVTPDRWLPLPWEKDAAETRETMSDEDKKYLMELMNNINSEKSEAK